MDWGSPPPIVQHNKKGKPGKKGGSIVGIQKKREKKNV